MGRLAWSQLRFRPARLPALLAGMLLATTAFTVLTAASRTAQLRTTGTVSAHFRPAYDILVRPKGARTALETRTGTVQPNFLSGIYGGISMSQYRQIASIPSVSVAAPVAMVGYALILAHLGWPLPAGALARPGRQLYRVSTTWVSDAGTSRVSQPASYVYVTPQPIRFVSNRVGTQEAGPAGRALVCPAQPAMPAQNPFSVAVQSSIDCWSKVTGAGLGAGAPRVPNPGWGTSWVIPVLIAAVDPAAEAKLDGLSHALTSGRYLPEHARDGAPAGGSATFPVLAAASSGLDEYAVTELQQLTPPQSPPVMNPQWLTRAAAQPGQTLVTERTTAQQAYRKLLATMSRSAELGAQATIDSDWSVGPVIYRHSAADPLTPLAVRNPASVWYTGQAYNGSYNTTPMDNADTQYRKLAVHAPARGTDSVVPASPQVVGTFNPAKVQSFDPLSQVPLGVYQPTDAAPANAAARAVLHGSDLLPNQNLGGYISQPADLITTLSALPALENSASYGSHLPSSDPVSVIRVRVAGVTGPNPVSLERIREAAQQIEQRTHLDVDIVAGSSPAPTSVILPAGQYGQPALALTENWVKKGVAVTILTAVDKNSVVLFALIIVVCVLFVANSASAAIRGRRRELGVLACLGWTRPRLFTAVLGEVAAVGLTAGVLGGAAALPLSAALGLHAAPGRAVLAVPVAVGVAVVASAVPAGLAARADPVTSVRPAVLGVRRARHPAGITGLAAVNVLRTPGRSLLGALSLAIGITALTMLTAVTFAFRGVVVGSLLGQAVAVQVRGVDYVATIATVALGVLAVADVVFLNIRERGAELATIRTFGWRESALSRLVATEGALIGLAGAVLGAALGLAGTAEFTGQLPAALYLVAGIAVVTGTTITALSALLPAQALRRLPAAHLLAEE